jgi:hypothetical protein
VRSSREPRRDSRGRASPPLRHHQADPAHHGGDQEHVRAHRRPPGARREERPVLRGLPRRSLRRPGGSLRSGSASASPPAPPTCGASTTASSACPQRSACDTTATRRTRTPRATGPISTRPANRRATCNWSTRSPSRTGATPSSDSTPGSRIRSAPSSTGRSTTLTGNSPGSTPTRLGARTSPSPRRPFRATTTARPTSPTCWSAGSRRPP